MESTEPDLAICGLCGKQIKPLGFENKIKRNHLEARDTEFREIGLELEISDFEKDVHLQCRIKCARYWLTGLRFRLLRPDKFVVTDNNKLAYNCIENIKKMSYENMRFSGLYLYGQPGTGKTLLLANLCCSLIDRGFNRYGIRWTNTSSILTDIRSSFGKKYEYGEETEQETILKDLHKPILFLDDLGTENATDWAKEILYGVINYRYEERLPTFISSNLRPQELSDRLGDKFVSRVIEMCKSVRIEGEDWRLHNADQRDQEVGTKRTDIPVFSWQMAGWRI